MSRLLTLQQIRAEKINLPPARFYEWLNAGQMPPPVKLGRRNLWPEAEINAWLDSFIEKRNRGEMALPPIQKRAAPRTKVEANPKRRGRPRKVSDGVDA